MELLPDKITCKNFNESEALLYLSKVIDILESRIQEQSYDIYNLILRISTSFYDYYHKFIDIVVEKYIKRNLVDILYTFLINQNEITVNKTKTLEFIYLIFVNFSEHSNLFAKTLKTSKALDDVIDEFLKFNLSNSQFKTDEFFKLFITIIHNFSSHSDNTIIHRVDEIKKCVVQILQLNCDDYFGIISMLILSYLINENETKLLNDNVNVLQKLIEKIKFTNESPLRSDGFTLKELIHGLRCISTNDILKVKIVEEGGILLLLDILKNHRDNYQIIESTLGVIEHLCFDKKIKSDLMENYNLSEIIKQFSKIDCKKITKICEGILWKLENKWQIVHNDKSRENINNKSRFDVFISYSWGNKEKVKEIHEKLKRYNIRAWIDEEQMTGSSLEAMANGIEESSLFIIAISSCYKKSSNCRHEAEYAFYIKKPIIPLIMELKYKPRSWLGFIVGMKMYFEFSERRNADLEVKKLKKSIETNLKKNFESNSDIDLESNGFKGESKKKKCNRYSSVKDWTNEDFNNWLDSCQMGYLKMYFTGFDGSFIETLMEIRSNSSEYFNNSLKNEFGMSFVDVVKFHKALNDLLE